MGTTAFFPSRMLDKTRLRFILGAFSQQSSLKSPKFMTKKLLAFFILLAASLPAMAASPAPLPANFYQNITLHFSVVQPGHSIGNNQGATVSNLTVSVPLVIKALGLVTSNHFSAKARLMGVSPVTYYTNALTNMVGGKIVTNNYVFGYPGLPIRFLVVDGTNEVDVTSLVVIVTVNTNLVSSFLYSKQGGYTAYANYRVRSMSFSNAMVSFSGQGFVETPLRNVPVGPKIVVVGYDDLWTSFSGVASGEFVNGVLQGAISAVYDHLK